MSRLVCVQFAVLLLQGCLVVPEGARPEVAITTLAASEYNFRGMTNVERGVAQGELRVDLPTKVEKGQLSFRTWANVDLHDDVGDAWFPEGHGGEPSQIDMSLFYSETYRGFDITTGLISYALQNPDDFPFAAERGETKEIFTTIATVIPWELAPSLSVHYDFDEVEDWYANAAIGREFPINEEFVSDASISLGYSGEDQSDWNYGFPESGLADLRGTGRVSYFLDPHTTIHTSLNYSTIVDEELRDWFDLIEIDSETFWLELGVTWAY
jgi:hypothetical protein